MRLTRILLAVLLAGCSGAVRQVQETEAAPAAPEVDPEFEAATALLAAGPVDTYVPLKWVERARQALDSDSDPGDYRGNVAAALRWAGLAAQAVMERPDSDLVFEVLSEHVRMCNHALVPEQAAGSLARLCRFLALDNTRSAYVAVLGLQGKLARTRMPDGTHSTRYLSYAAPGLLEEMASAETALSGLFAPEQGDKARFAAWLRLRIAWASIVSSMVGGTALALSRSPSDDWKSTGPAFEKRLHQAIWHVPADRYPAVASLFYLRLFRFHVAYGDAQKAQEALFGARRLVVGAGDMNGIARVDLAEADHILAPGSSVETLGVLTGGPDATDSAPDPPPDIRPPEPESVWRERAARVRPLLDKAELTFRKGNNGRGLAATWLRRGYIEARLGGYDEAGEYYRQSEAVSEMASDPAARIVALFHLMVLELTEGATGRAQQAARRMFAVARESGLTPMGIGLGDALLGFAGRELTRFGNPDQRLAVIHLSALCYELAGSPLLVLRHQATLLRLAAHFRYYEVIRYYAAKALAAAGGREAPLEAAEGPRCDVAQTAAAALLPSPVYAEESVALAERALRCIAPGASAQAVDPDEVRMTAALAWASAGQPERARSFLDSDDLNSLLLVALRAGEIERVADVLRQFAAAAKEAWVETLPPEEPEGTGEPEALPEPPDPAAQAAAEAARVNLAGEVLRLAQAILDSGGLKLEAGGGTSPPEFEEARALLDGWKELTGAPGDWNVRPWEVLALHGQVAAGLGEPDAAWLFFSGALQAIWKEREGTRGLTQRSAFTQSVAPVFQRIMLFLLSQAGRDGGRKFEIPGQVAMDGAAAALALLEDLKAQELAGLLESGVDYRARLLDPQDGRALVALAQRRRNARCEEEYWSQAGGVPADRLATLRSDAANVETWLEQSVSDLTMKYPALAFARGVPGAVDLGKMATLAGERNVTFVAYAATLPVWYAWVVDSKGVRAVRLGRIGREADRLVRQLRLALARPQGSGGEVETAAGRLFELLMLPLAGELAEGRTLGIVPDGSLHSLPFGMLRHGESFLVQRHPFFVVPSLRLYGQLMEREEEQAAAGEGILFLADPQLMPPAAASAGGSGGGPKPGALPGVRTVEVPPLVRLLDVHGIGSPAVGGAEPLAAALSAMSGSGEVTVATGAGATEAAFHKFGGDARILHFSTPVLPFAAEPMFAGLVLAHSDSPDEDGLLQSWEIAVKPLKARLAVVAAAPPGPGMVVEEEALAGLARGFFTAGIPVVVTNQVPVASEAAGDLLKRFYEAVLSGSTPCAALRKAALSLRSDPRFSGTAAWGAFSVYGLGDR